MNELREISIDRLRGDCKKESVCEVREELMEIAVRNNVEFMLTQCDRFEKRERAELKRKK